jgi:hypothetical protein
MGIVKTVKCVIIQIVKMDMFHMGHRTMAYLLQPYVMFVWAINGFRVIITEGHIQKLKRNMMIGV